MGKSVRKLTPRERRKYRIRSRLTGTSARPRVSVFRSAKYTYAQIISDEEGKTLASGSTKDADVLGKLGDVKIEGSEDPSKSSKSAVAAKGLGVILAEKCAAKGIKEVVFDRNGFLYHGRIKALADGLREGGIAV